MRTLQADWNHWPDHPTPAAADPECWAAVQAHGLDGVEVGVYDAAVELAPAREASRDELARRHGVPVAALLLSLPAQRWPAGALTGPAAAGERLVGQVDGCAAVAALHGLDTLGLWPGADPAGADLAGAVTTLRRCRDAAAEHGVRLAVEYKPGTVVSTVDEAVELAELVPRTGVLLDTGHAWAAGEDPDRCVRALAAVGLLWQVHLGDAAPGNADDDLPLGRLHDPAALLAALRATDYAGTAAFDLYGAVSAGVCTGEQALAESMAALRTAGSVA